MLSVPIFKDVGEYQEKIVGKLSLRTLVCVAGGLATAVAVAAFTFLVLRVDAAYACLPMVMLTMPFWLAGFWRPRGMKAEEFLPLLLFHELTDDRLVYESAYLSEGDPRPEEPLPKPDRKARRAARRKGAESHVHDEA